MTDKNGQPFHAPWTLVCVECQQSYPGLDLRYRCDCGGILDVAHELAADLSTDLFDQRLLSRAPVDRSGVWRFRELVLPIPEQYMAARPEGNTNLYHVPDIARQIGLDDLRLKHEGENPTGSFKDRGMTSAVSLAKLHGMTRVACASTGNTSASMAAYAAREGMDAYVFIPEGNVAFGKLSQALAYGARTIQIEGDFDAAMSLVQQVCDAADIYLLNSINPFRIEGQKAIGFELLQDLEWEVPDWIVLPGGNLGNNSAISKGLSELLKLGLIDRLPRMAIIQAAGANPLYTAIQKGGDVVPMKPDTIATAIKIGDPVSWRKSMRGITEMKGVVEQVTDQEIMDAKALVDGAGIGAEPASCATVAGIKKLVAAGVIEPDAHVCGILTGHVLKDPDNVVNYHLGKLDGIKSTFANAPIKTEGSLEAILRLINQPD